MSFPEGTDFSSLDAKLETLNLQGDIEIYDFDDNWQGGDELDDETFGAGPVGKDFDFAGQTAAATGLVPNSAPRTPQVEQPGAGQAQHGSAWSSLDSDALLGPSRSSGKTQGQSARRGLTVEELEGQMTPQRTLSRGPSVPPQQQQQPRRAARTLEEIEAEMLASARAQPSPQMQPQQPAILQQQAMPPQHFMQGFPPAGMMPPGFPHIQLPPGMLPPGMHPMALAQLQAQAQAQAQQRNASPAMMQQQMQQMMLANNQQNFPSLQAAASMPQHPGLPTPPPRSSQGNMSLGQLHALRMNILSRPASEDTQAMLAQLQDLIAKAEATEHQRRKLASKWAEIAPYNNLMSQNEKDFITRIQISQLINSSGPGGEHDPLREDFYFTVYSAIKGAKNQNKEPAAAVASAPSAGGEKKHERRRQNQAMQKMANQVQRIVNDARKKPTDSQVSLDGALGKIAIRGKSAPKPALQVSPATHQAAVNATGPEAASLSASIAAGAGQASTRPALTRRQALLALEKVYDCVLELEQIKRTQPQMAHYISVAADSAGDLSAVKQAFEQSKDRYQAVCSTLWDALKVGQPLEVSNPHPFVSLLAPPKGKKLLPRVLRHTTPDQTLTIFLLILATFQSLDVVQDASLLDEPRALDPSSAQARARADAEHSTELFLSTVAPSFITHLGKQPLKVVAGLLGVLLERNDLATVAKSRAGIAFLTVFLSRAHLLKKLASEEAPQEGGSVPDEAELTHWSNTFNVLFSRLQEHWNMLFPSTRAQAALPFGAGQYLNGPGGNLGRSDLDFEDEAVWSFLGALAVNCDNKQQQTLVVQVRDKVLECSGAKAWASPEVVAIKTRNVNLMLHALGLDASHIS